MAAKNIHLYRFVEEEPSNTYNFIVVASNEEEARINLRALIMREWAGKKQANRAAKMTLEDVEDAIYIVQSFD